MKFLLPIVTTVVTAILSLILIFGINRLAVCDIYFIGVAMGLNLAWAISGLIHVIMEVHRDKLRQRKR